jgi:hypothetical protein
MGTQKPNYYYCLALLWYQLLEAIHGGGILVWVCTCVCVITTVLYSEIT